MPISIGRPASDEAAPYYRHYINLVTDVDPRSVLRDQCRETEQLLRTLTADRWDFRYAPGKWNIKEAMVHLIDTERVFAYRSMRIARGDQTPLPGFEHMSYVQASGARDRRPESVITEYLAVREATLQLLKHLPESAWDKRGIASDNPVSVRALAYIMAGHEIHHMQIIRQRYLSDPTDLA